VLLHTDGISEATNANEEVFSLQRLVTILEASGHVNAETLVKRVLSAVRMFTGSAPQSDDLTLMAVRYTGAPSQIS
jgi:sigma-B regulation protein RsbU (phosphoserine phosphatase)